MGVISDRESTHSVACFELASASVGLIERVESLNLLRVDTALLGYKQQEIQEAELTRFTKAFISKYIQLLSLDIRQTLYLRLASW